MPYHGGNSARNCIGGRGGELEEQGGVQKKLKYWWLLHIRGFKLRRGGSQRKMDKQ